jgi:hypothetical protein
VLLLLVSSDGNKSRPHPISLGMTKAIVLGPGQELDSSLLFGPISGEPEALHIYEKRVPLTRRPGSFKGGKGALR